MAPDLCYLCPCFTYRSLDNRVIFVLLPCLAAIGRHSQTLTLSSILVRKSPRCGQLGNRGVEDEESAVNATSQVDGLASTGEDTETVVAAVTRRAQCQSISALPATDICPRDHVSRGGMSPRDVTPVDVLGVPLVEGVVKVLGGIIHETTGIVHPSSRRNEMVLGTPSGEKSVVAHRLDHRSSQCLAEGSCAHKAGKSKRALHCDEREGDRGSKGGRKDLLDGRYCEMIPRGLYIPRAHETWGTNGESKELSFLRTDSRRSGDDMTRITKTIKPLRVSDRQRGSSGVSTSVKLWKL